MATIDEARSAFAKRETPKVSKTPAKVDPPRKVPLKKEISSIGGRVNFSVAEYAGIVSARCDAITDPNEFTKLIKDQIEGAEDTMRALVAEGEIILFGDFILSDPDRNLWKRSLECVISFFAVEPNGVVMNLTDERRDKILRREIDKISQDKIDGKEWARVIIIRDSPTLEKVE